ncbi:pumilio homolog 3-like [Asterias amurensis]|uniref:pumilio homolog 3-like n=1 Tax=Asterias amurensis TaxID=7602 RepID=UPI003AB67858
MVKPKVKSMAASKLASSAVKSKATPTFKKSKKFTKRVGTQGLNAQKKSTQAVNTGKQLHTLKESKEGEKSKTSAKLPTKKKPANKAGVKRKKDDDQGKEDNPKHPKLEELSFKDRKAVRRNLKSNHELTQRAKVIWNSVREKKCSSEKRVKLLTELCGLITGKVFELLSAHDTVRVVQCCLQYGSSKQRQDIFDEINDSSKIMELAKGKYSKHFVLKMLKYGTKDHRARIMKCLHGQVCKSVRHKEAAEVLEMAFNNYANAMQRSALLEEFYGPRFAIFKEAGIHSLQDILSQQPEARQGIMEHMQKTLTQVIEKSVVKHSIVHKVLLDFLEHAPMKMKTELIEGLRDTVVQILHTHDGARAAMYCLWHGTAKDRKAIIKSFKTFVCKISKEEYGHQVLLALFDCVDDTVLVRKVIIEEMMKSVEELAEDQYGRKVLLYLLSPRHPTHFHPKVVELLQKGDSNTTSKKDSKVRQQELLQTASSYLLDFVSENAREMANSKSKCLLMIAVLNHAIGDKREGYQAISSLAAEEFIPALGSDNEEQLNEVHIIEHPAGHLVIRRLLQQQKKMMENTKESGVMFSDVLLDTVDSANLQAWTRANRGALVLASLLDCGKADCRERVIATLKPIINNLSKIKTKGMEVLKEKLQETRT